MFIGTFQYEFKLTLFIFSFACDFKKLFGCSVYTDKADEFILDPDFLIFLFDLELILLELSFLGPYGSALENIEMYLLMFLIRLE